MKRWISVLFLALLVFTMPLSYVKAAEPSDYTYKVTVYAGNQGTFSGASSTEFTIDGIASGTTVSITLADLGITLKDADRYYVRGLKEAGHDNDDEFALGSFQVNEDVSLVVSYGVRDANMVSYTVEYIDQETGAALADPDTYEGRVGDKPIVSHKYIPDYLPNALNETKTLVAGEENVFTFYYAKVTEYTRTIYETIYGPGTGGGATPTGGGGGTTPASGGEGGNGEDNTGGQEAPPEVVDIDDPDPPLAPGGGNNVPGNSGSGNLNQYIAYGLGAAAVVALGAWFLLFARRKREEEDEDEEE